MAERIDIGRGLFISADLITETFVQASGPGGQNVNKVATAVSLRFDLRRSGLPHAVRRRVAEAAGRRLTRYGELIIKGAQHRTLAANRQDARERLIALLRAAAIPPLRRVKTKPSRAARALRTDRKVRRGHKKALRGKPSLDS